MGLLDVDLSDVGIVLDHLQGGMPEQALQGEQVPAGTQVGDREGVSESMWMGFSNPRLLPQRGDGLAQGVPVQRPAELADEERRLGVLPLLPVGQVALQETPGGFAGVDRPPLAALGLAFHAGTDMDPPGLLVHVPHPQGAQLAGPQTGVEEHHQDGLVALAGRALHNVLAPVVGVCLGAVVAGLEQGFNVLALERLHRRVLGTRGRGIFFIGSGISNSRLAQVKKAETLT